MEEYTLLLKWYLVSEHDLHQYLAQVNVLEGLGRVRLEALEP